MLRTGDWITPSYDGQVSLDNPPLFLQLMAGSFLLFGVRDYAAILPSALSGVLCVVLLHALARRLRFGSFAAWAAAVVLLTTQYFLKYSRHAMFDVFLTLLFLLAIGAYLRAREGGRALRPARLPLRPGRAHQERARPLSAGGRGAAPGLERAPAGSGALRDRPDRHAADGRAVVRDPAPGERPAADRGTSDGCSSSAASRRRRPGWGTTSATCAASRPSTGRGFRPRRGGSCSPRAAWGGARARSEADAPGRVWSDRDTARLLLLWLAVVIGVMSVGREKKLWYVMTAFPALALCAALALESWIRPGAPRRRAVLGSAAALLALGLWLNAGPMRHGTLRQPGSTGSRGSSRPRRRPATAS